MSSKDRQEWWRTCWRYTPFITTRVYYEYKRADWAHRCSSLLPQLPCPPQSVPSFPWTPHKFNPMGAKKKLLLQAILNTSQKCKMLAVVLCMHNSLHCFETCPAAPSQCLVDWGLLPSTLNDATCGPADPYYPLMQVIGHDTDPNIPTPSQPSSCIMDANIYEASFHEQDPPVSIPTQLPSPLPGPSGLPDTLNCPDHSVVADSGVYCCIIDPFPGDAGALIAGPDSGSQLSHTDLTQDLEMQDLPSQNIWAPFQSHSDWQVACWSKMYRATTSAVNVLLAVPEVHISIDSVLQSS